MSMNVVSQTRLREFWATRPSARRPLTNWYAAASSATWTCFDDVRKTSNSADLVNKLVVFNVNSFRVVVDVFYPGRHVYIKHVFTHTEYEKWSKQNQGK